MAFFIERKETASITRRCFLPLFGRSLLGTTSAYDGLVKRNGLAWDLKFLDGRHAHGQQIA